MLPRIRILVIAISALLLVVAVWAQQVLISQPSREARYYLTALALAAGMVMVAVTIDTIFARRKKQTAHRPAADRDSGGENRRRAYRILYPSSQRPFLKIRQRNFNVVREHHLPVVDISELGIRFLNEEFVDLRRKVSGELCFPNGGTIQFKGEIVRRHKEEMGLSLSSPIPYDRIMEEQRRVLAGDGEIPLEMS